MQLQVFLSRTGSKISRFFANQLSVREQSEESHWAKSSEQDIYLSVLLLNIVISNRLPPVKIKKDIPPKQTEEESKSSVATDGTNMTSFKLGI